MRLPVSSGKRVAIFHRPGCSDRATLASPAQGLGYGTGRRLEASLGVVVYSLYCQLLGVRFPRRSKLSALPFVLVEDRYPLAGRVGIGYDLRAGTVGFARGFGRVKVASDVRAEFA